jgi:hypothetical protein
VEEDLALVSVEMEMRDVPGVPDEGIGRQVEVAVLLGQSEDLVGIGTCRRVRLRADGGQAKRGQDTGRGLVLRAAQA